MLAFTIFYSLSSNDAISQFQRYTKVKDLVGFQITEKKKFYDSNRYPKTGFFCLI